MTEEEQLEFDFMQAAGGTQIFVDCTAGEDWVWRLPPSTPSAPAGCQHEWKEYVGLVEKYNYCTKCDAKDFGSQR